jgi:hypothetical protein
VSRSAAPEFCGLAIPVWFFLLSSPFDVFGNPTLPDGVMVAQQILDLLV